MGMVCYLYTISEFLQGSVGWIYAALLGILGLSEWAAECNAKMVGFYSELWLEPVA